MLANGVVAVKRLKQTISIDDEKFKQEVACLMRVKHKNIVRFLGYCADTQWTMVKFDGRHVMAEVRQRLLCLEYIPNGSLDNYISGTTVGTKILFSSLFLIPEICFVPMISSIVASKSSL